MAIYSIYRITNLVDGKVYIGKTKQKPIDRWHRHVRDASKGSQTLLHRAMRKHGIENFKLDVIFNTILEADLNEFEQYFINEYHSFMATANGYNMTKGGDGISPDLCSSIQKKKVAAGEHFFQTDRAQEIRKASMAKLLAEGRHPFQGSIGSALAKKQNAIFNVFKGENGTAMHRKQMSEGRHQSQKTHVCPHCNKEGKGAGMFNWHFDKCKNKSKN